MLLRLDSVEAITADGEIFGEKTFEFFGICSLVIIGEHSAVAMEVMLARRLPVSWRVRNLSVCGVTHVIFGLAGEGGSMNFVTTGLFPFPATWQLSIVKEPRRDEEVEEGLAYRGGDIIE